MKSFTAITLLFIALLGSGIYLATTYQPESTVTVETPQTVNTPPVTEQQNVESSPAPQTAEINSEQDTATKTATTHSNCTQGGTCTQAEVALHHTRADCYVSMSNLAKVYDITAYVKQNSSMHPGGDIADYCGEDIYITFVGADGSHRHSGRAMQDLSSFEFATLQQ